MSPKRKNSFMRSGSNFRSLADKMDGDNRPTENISAFVGMR